MGWDFLNTLLLLNVNNNQNRIIKGQQQLLLQNKLEKLEAIYCKAQEARDDMDAREDEFDSEEYDRLVDECEDLLDEAVQAIVDVKRQIRELNT